MNTEQFNLAYLDKWMEDNKLEERAKEGCFTYLENYLIHHPQDFNERFILAEDIKNIETELYKIDLTISYRNDFEPSPIEYISMILKMMNSEKVIGYYKSIFSLDGEEIDDYILDDETF